MSPSAYRGDLRAGPPRSRAHARGIKRPRPSRLTGASAAHETPELGDVKVDRQRDDLPVLDFPDLCIILMQVTAGGVHIVVAHDGCRVRTLNDQLFQQDLIDRSQEAAERRPPCPIVAATDGSAGSLRAIEWAVREAVLRSAPLQIISAASLPKMVLLPLQPERDAVLGFVREHRDRALAAAAARAAEMAPGLRIDTYPVQGQAARAVTGTGSGALMLVVGFRGIGTFAATVLGSVARYAADHASCPVVVIRDQTAAARRLVGVGVGDLDDCTGTLAFAFEEAALRQASLIAIHAWHAPQAGTFWAGTHYPPPGLHVAAAAAARQLTLLDGHLAPEVPRRPGPARCRTRSSGPGAGRPVGPGRPSGHRQARHALWPAVSWLGEARRAEPRLRPGRHRPVILTAIGGVRPRHRQDVSGVRPGSMSLQVLWWR